MTTDMYVLVGLVIFGASLAYALFLRWQRGLEKSQVRQLEQTERAAERQAAELRALTERTMRFQEESAKNQNQARKEAEKHDSVSAETTGLNSGGYIIFNMPD